MRIAKTQYVQVGDTIELQTDLEPYEVKAITKSTLSAIHDTDAPQTTYKHEFDRVTSPSNGSIKLDDGDVVADFDGNNIHYLTQVE